MSAAPFTMREIVAVMGGYVVNGGQSAKVPGPGHSKNDDSLSISFATERDGYVVESFAGDGWQECDAYFRHKMNLPQWAPTKKPEPRPAAKPKAKTGAKTKVAEYVYHDANNEPYHKVIRYEYEGGGKSFDQKHWHIDGWADKAGDLPPIPYNLPAIIANPDQTVWLVEGEKNAADLISRGLLATTAKGGADSFPTTPDFAVWFDGCKVVALPDNDAPGEKWLSKVLQCAPHAVVVRLPGLGPKEDVSDWLANGGTVDQLIQYAETPPDEFVTDMNADPEPASPPRISATAFEWIDPALIPPREWLYDAHLIRKFVSMTVSPGGLGKSSLALIDAMSMASGRALFADSTIHEPDPLRVWYWNGEDPNEETRRRVVAAALHYDLKPDQFASRLFTDSGREQALILGSMIKGEIDLNEDFFADLEGEIIAKSIDVLIIDPFVSAHRMGENDNNAIDAILKRLGKLAERCNCAVEIIHHVRKPSQGSTTKTEVHDARGASALIGGVRSARVLNVMDDKISDAENIPKESRERYFSVIDGKANMSLKDPNGRWRFLESVCLGNQTETRKADNVGVVTYYKLSEAAKAVEDLSQAEEEMRLILSRDDLCRHWGGKGRKPKNWLGHRIMDALDLHDAVHEDAMQKLIIGWLKDKIIAKRSVSESGNLNTYLTLKSEPYAAPDPDSDVPF